MSHAVVIYDRVYVCAASFMVTEGVSGFLLLLPVLFFSFTFHTMVQHYLAKNMFSPFNVNLNIFTVLCFASLFLY